MGYIVSLKETQEMTFSTCVSTTELEVAWGAYTWCVKACSGTTTVIPHLEPCHLRPVGSNLQREISRFH